MTKQELTQELKALEDTRAQLHALRQQSKKIENDILDYKINVLVEAANNGLGSYDHKTLRTKHFDICVNGYNIKSYLVTSRHVDDNFKKDCVDNIPSSWTMLSKARKDKKLCNLPNDILAELDNVLAFIKSFNKAN